MKKDRIVSVSTAAFDGYDLSVAINEISRLGVEHVEVAFIQGYMEAFGEEIFSLSNAKKICNLLLEANLSCFAFSAHMDLISEKSAEIFKKRMDFVHQVGARIIISNAGPKAEYKAFMKNMERLVEKAESLNMIIGLENPGDGKENIIDSGKAGTPVLQQIGSDLVRFNYDFGNVISHFFERLRPEEDFTYALPFSAHLHIKDVKSNGQGWSFVEIGKGSIDYSFILKTLASKYQQIPISLEIPLRITRDRDASPRRAASPLPLDEIRNVLKGSLNYVKGIIENRVGTNCDA
jgi:sugar phosphate isomerase/epimerase